MNDVLENFEYFIKIEEKIEKWKIKIFSKNIKNLLRKLSELFEKLIFSYSALEYCLDVGNMNLSAIRTVRVLRPLRAINRIPSKS